MSAARYGAQFSRKCETRQAGKVVRLPRGRPLRSAKVHSAADGSFVLDVFEFGEAPSVDPKDPELAGERERILASAGAEGGAREALARHLAACPAEYLRTVADERIVRHWTVCRGLWGTADSVVDLSPEPNPAHVRIDLATGGGSPQTLFTRLVRYLGWRGLDIRRHARGIPADVDCRARFKPGEHLIGILFKQRLNIHFFRPVARPGQ